MKTIPYTSVCMFVCMSIASPLRAQSEAAVSATRAHQQPELAPAPEQIVQAQQPAEAPSRTGRSQSQMDLTEQSSQGIQDLPQALATSPGVMMQKTSAAGGAPIMRGMMGPQVLILVDGQRLNNAIWRTGPVQYLNALNLNAFDSLDVQRGADSARYGGGALGGVITLHSHQAAFADQGFVVHGNSSLRYASAADAKAAAGHADVGFKRMALHLGGDIEDFLILRGGRETGLQPDTSFQRGDLSASLRFSPTDNQQVSIRYMALHQYNVPRPDKCKRDQAGQIIDCRQRTEQFIDLASLRWSREASGFFDRLQASLDFQKFHEFSERERWDKGRTERKRDGDLVFSSQAFASHLLPSLPFGLLRLNLGGELSYDQISSEGWRQNLSLDMLPPRPDDYGESDPGLATVADGSTYLSAGAFLQQEYLFSDTFSVDFALRYTAYQATAPISDRLPRGLNRSFSAPSASLAAEYQMTDWLSLGGNLVHAYRAPNIYDLTGRDFFGGGYEFANAAELGPERLSGGELVSKLHLGALRLNLSAYANLLHDLIVRQAQDFAGASQVDGEQSFARVNAGQAYLYGLEAALRLQLGDHAEAYANAMYTYGQDITHDEPLSRIAPLMGIAGLRSRPYKKLALGAEAHWALEQTRLSARDVSDARIPEGGTASYIFMDLFASYQLLSALEINARLHNLFDADYRVHGSGVNGPGVEGRVAIRVKF